MSESMEITHPVLVVAGPTAVGKTALCAMLFDKFDCELISMDSMQVYRKMDIGTAKPSKQEQGLAPHHLIDIRNPDEQYDAAQFVADCLHAVASIHKQGKLPLVTGGTGLYLNALLNGLFKGINVADTIKQSMRTRLATEGRAVLYQELASLDPETAGRLHPNDTQRIVRGLEIYHGTGTPWSEHLKKQAEQHKPVCFTNLLQIGLACEREALYDRIGRRTLQMFKQGLIDEVAGLREEGYAADLPSMQAIGYRHVNAYLDSNISLKDTKIDLVQDTRHYAKRQLTWFNRNKDILWIHRADHDQVIRLTSELLLKKQ